MTGSLRQLLERGAVGHPDTVIVSGAGQRITWRDLHGQARRTATGKVVKPVLRERYWQGHDRRIH
jgi:hypothetical protein